MRKVNRVDEVNYNNFGSKMIIVKYNNNCDIDVYFPEYDCVVKHIGYKQFKKGWLRCPYEPRCYGVGYLGEGKYKVSENGKLTKVYNTWKDMLRRCYDEKYQEKHPTYNACEVCTEWHNFQAFAEWYENNYYQIEDEVISLDKDILSKGNKIYSPETCVFVPQNINTLFTKCDKSRGNDPIGTSKRPFGNYQVYCNNGYGDYLGVYSTKEEAFKIYKHHKEKIIKEVIDSYEGIIPEPHYSRLKKAMYNYRVEIDD